MPVCPGQIQGACSVDSSTYRAHYLTKLREDGETKPNSVHGRFPARPGTRCVVCTILLLCNRGIARLLLSSTSCCSVRLTSGHT